MKSVLAKVAIVLALISLPGLVFVSGQITTREQYHNCIQDRKSYDVLHNLIAESGKPNTAGNLKNLQLPSDVPQWFRDVLAQLSVKPDPHALDRFYSVLGERPECTPPGLVSV